MTMSTTPLDSTVPDVSALPQGSFAKPKFNRNAFMTLGGVGMLIGLAIPALGYVLFAGSIVATDDLASRLTLGFRWMVFPVLAIVLGFQVAGMTRFRSVNADGSPPADDSPLAMHRRYLQNTLEQFAYFFITQMALVTVLPATALHLIPIFAIQFLLARLIFWRGYVTNPAHRALGLTMNHVNLLVLGYVIFQVLSGS